jgi:preprotein translocase subunit SecA
VADLREGIHLRALGRGLGPLDEFYKELTLLFAPLLGEVATRSAASFRTVAISPDGADLDAAGLKRPTATWTYLVQDNPFGTDLDRAIRGLARLLRKPPRTEF